MQDALADPATLGAYPDLELSELKRVIANCINVTPEHIVVANGFVPLLEAALRSRKIRRCLLPLPCFSEYRRSLENAGAAVVPYLLAQDHRFAYDPGSILNAVLENDCDAILMANPQNPSGALCQAEQMRLVLEIAARNGVTVLVDEAFIDYCPDQSLSRYALDHPNLTVFRSVTKFFAIPGLRVAYSVCNSPEARAMGHYVAPWPITKLAADGVCAALRDEAYAEASIPANRRCRDWLIRELEHLQVDTYPSNANFLLLRFPSQINVRTLWEGMIVSQRIVLRSCENFDGLAPGHLRMAIRSQSDNERLIMGLKQVLTEGDVILPGPR